MRNPYVAGVAIAFCVIVFYLANTEQFFGKFINRFSPCVQSHETSFPCYGMYDIVLMTASAAVGAILLCLLLWDLYKRGVLRLTNRKRLALLALAVIAFVGVLAVARHIPGSVVGSPLIRAIPTNAASRESAEFAQKIQRYFVENIVQPIDSGFTASLYLQAFSGLTESDFDGVETLEGSYVYADGKLDFTRPQTKIMRISTAEEAITENGHTTLFDALRMRLGDDLSVDDLISHIQNDTSSPFVSVGDMLGAMTVVSVKPFNTGQYSTDPRSMIIGPRNVQITLKGPIEVMGAYSAVHSGIGFDGYCMSSISDVASLSRMPVFPVRGGPPDIRSYFCFRNSEMAQKILGEKSRTITVAIDNYQLNSYPAEVVDWADLIDVVKE